LNLWAVPNCHAGAWSTRCPVAAFLRRETDITEYTNCASGNQPPNRTIDTDARNSNARRSAWTVSI
ncbi:MAG: hypothetical protein ACM37Z_17570, partial [Deltaproteobacteria bacterium]